MSRSELILPEFNFSARGCMIRCFIIGSIAFITWIAYLQIKPHFRVPTPIEVMVLDSEGKPCTSADILYDESMIIPWIPLLPFGPARTIYEKNKAVTDAHGVARFSIRFDGYLAMIRISGKKVVVHHATTKSYQGTYTLKSIEGAGIAQWFPAPSPTIIQTTLVILAEDSSHTQ